MKKILVPTDFSACANYAAQVAINLAKGLNSWVYFLNISPEPAVKSMVHSEVELETHHQEVSTAKSQLDEWVRKGESVGVTCFPILVFDNGTEKIENYIKPYSIDLIVMGSHGTKGIRKLIIGSNAERVIKHASVPVVVVKKQAEAQSLNAILYASTFNEKTNADFSWVANLVNGLNGQLHLLYLSNDTNPESEQAAYNKMEKLASGYPGLQYALDYAITNDYEWAISNVADKVNAGIIAISENEKEGGLLSVNVALKLVTDEDRPVLVLKR
jgi:nucleotide-binding universal stress UspA family protein